MHAPLNTAWIKDRSLCNIENTKHQHSNCPETSVNLPSFQTHQPNPIYASGISMSRGGMAESLSGRTGNCSEEAVHINVDDGTLAFAKPGRGGCIALTGHLLRQSLNPGLPSA